MLSSLLVGKAFYDSLYLFTAVTTKDKVKLD